MELLLCLSPQGSLRFAHFMNIFCVLAILEQCLVVYFVIVGFARLIDGKLIVLPRLCSLFRVIRSGVCYAALVFAKPVQDALG